ncbi:MAG: cytochrome c peroxidase [Rubricoccaceae bacterium]|nr:cytochrome c peroxidase [Rubricoccaceae bacterium]
MPRTRLILLLGALALLAACDNATPEAPSLDAQLREAVTAAAEGAGLDAFRVPDDGDLAAIPQDPRNPLTPEKVALGRLLMHETALAVNPTHAMMEGTYSCASCHHVAAGFRAGVPQGLADGGVGFGHFGERRRPHPDYAHDELDRQPIRSPSLMNGAYQAVTLWNGQFGAAGPNAGTEAEWTEGTPIVNNRLGYEGLETQAIAALTVHRMQDGPAFVIETLPEYAARFAAAFPDFRATDPAIASAEMEMAGLAIAAWERTVLPSEAPFQRWLRGETDAMTAAQKRGAILFFGRAGCVSCHGGPALANMSFHALGMGELTGPGVFSDFNPKDPVHLGRGGFTQRDADTYRFKVPQLYNLADDAFLGHGATFASIRDVVAYKNAAVPQSTLVPADRLDPLFVPLGLTEDEVDDLAMFLERGLYDARLGRHVPEALPSGSCFPNNDPQSRIDLGCEDGMARPRALEGVGQTRFRGR